VEARVGGRALALGGEKQRTVLALLVLGAGKPIPIERLIDDVWGESPPPSAAHTLEGYVSRLRRLLEPLGAAIERRGGGYRLELGGGTVDAVLLQALVADAEDAARSGDDERAAALAADAVRLWRGPALADVRLPADADRLEELRLQALEQRFDAELRLGRHEGVIADLRPLVAEHRHRERLVAQLMVALYRSGRHAEALDVYEATRRSLGDELGLQPSADLQRLSGEIVRQEPSLLVAASRRLPTRPAGPSRRSRIAAVVLVGAVAAGVAGVALTRSAGESPGRSTRVLLLLHRPPSASLRDPIPSSLVEGLKLAERRYGVTIDTLVVPEGVPTAPAAVAATKRLQSDPVDLVIAPLRTIFSLRGVADLRETRFVSIDVDWPEALPRNTTAFVFDDRQSGYLVGYLSGLMERRSGTRLNARHVVSFSRACR
jgi:DNA-binding SARP family transcriptional activator